MSPAGGTSRDEEVKVEAVRWTELPWHHAPVTFDDDRYLDVFVDYSRGRHFVRLDVEVPAETLTEGLAGPDDDVPHGSLWLSADRAEALALSLPSRAAAVREPSGQCDA